MFTAIKSENTDTQAVDYVLSNTTKQAFICYICQKLPSAIIHHFKKIHSPNETEWIRITKLYHSLIQRICLVFCRNMEEIQSHYHFFRFRQDYRPLVWPDWHSNLWPLDHEQKSHPAHPNAEHWNLSHPYHISQPSFPQTVSSPILKFHHPQLWYSLCLWVILRPEPHKLIEMVRTEDGPITCEVVKVVHNDSHEQVDDLEWE